MRNAGNEKISKLSYTTKFKELAVKRITDEEAISVAVKELGQGARRHATESRQRRIREGCSVKYAWMDDQI